MSYFQGLNSNSANDEKPKEQRNKLRYNLGWHPNGGKPKELRMNID